MLERILENWLTNASERSYELPFAQLLSIEGYRVLHGPVHHPFEHGKDILAISGENELCAFQLKGGNIDLSQFEAIQGQLMALCGTAVTYPGIEPPRRPDRVFLVFNGSLTPPARGRIEAFNHANRNLFFPSIECVEIDNLLGRFAKTFGHFLPTELRELNTFLSIYLSDGEDLFPVHKYANLVGSLLGSLSGSSPIIRAMASTILLTSYAAAPWYKTQNHLAVAQAWYLTAINIIREAAKNSIPEEAWLNSYEIALEGFRRPLQDLLVEADSAADLVITSLVDGFVYPTRALLVCAYLSAFLVSEKSHARGCDYDAAVKRVLLREIDFVKVIGEAGFPALLTIATALELLEEPVKALELVLSWVVSICESNSVGSLSALPDPYHRVEDLLEISLNEGLDERFDGVSYSLHIAIDWLARRSLRKAVEECWPAVTRLTFSEFVCSDNRNLLSASDEEGYLRSWQPSTPESWARLSREAADLKEACLPEEVWRHSEVIPFLGLLLPYRFTSSVAKALDYVALSYCNMSFLEDEDA